MAAEQVIRFYGKTDVGRRRDHNEDAFFYSEADDFVVLADGMGGRHFGEVAANMTVDLLRERFESFFPPSYRDLRLADQTHCADMVTTLVHDWVRDVNVQVWSKGQNDERFREMGTTLVLAYTLPSLIVIAHIGDSRAYHLSGTSFEQVTKDHSLVNSQVDNGLMTIEEAQTSNQKNIITRAIGTSRNVHPEWTTRHVKKGDRLLLCSDGLTDMVEDEVVRDIMMTNEPAAVLQNLIDEANANGGRDNITIVLIEYED